MENSGKKYQIDTEENKMFLGELQKNLLNFGKGFLSPGGSAYFLGDDGTPWKDRNRETWITCRMVHVYSMGIMLGDKESPALVHGAVHGLLEELKDRENGGWYPEMCIRDRISDSSTGSDCRNGRQFSGKDHRTKADYCTFFL